MLHYILPKWSKLSQNTKAELEDGEAVFRLNEGKNRIELEFVCFNPYVCAALFGSGCMFVIGTVIMIRRIRRKKEYKKSERIRT